MYLTPYQKKQLRTFLILLIGIPLTVFAVYKGVQYVSNANVEGTPKDVVVSNITTNSITISWVTEKSVEGYIVPILNDTEQNPVQDKRGSGKRFSHYVEIKSLEPSTKYSFQIISGGDKYSSSDGNDFEFTTASIGVTTPIPNPIHGTVTGFSKDDVVIYVMLKNKTAYPVSAIVPSGGNWIMDLSSFRKISDKDLLTIADDTELVLLAKSGASEGVTVEGTYSALFDSNGKLNTLYSLSIEESTDLISFFPAESKLGIKIIAEEDPKVETPDPEEEPSAEDPTPEEEAPVENDKDGENSGDDYSITHDIEWKNLVQGEDWSGLEAGGDTILITNLTDTGFTVIWRSSSEEEGYVKYGTSEGSMPEKVKDTRDGLTTANKYYSHVVDVERLSPDTIYYFAVYSGEKVLDSTNSVKTLSTLNSAPPFDTRSGTLEDSENPADWVLVAQLIDADEVGTLGESKYISTIPDENGSWIMTIGDVRSNDGTQYFSSSTSDTLKIYILGNKEKTFDFDISQTDITLSLSELSLTSSGKVELLDNYGILISK